MSKVLETLDPPFTTRPMKDLKATKYGNFRPSIALVQISIHTQNNVKLGRQ